MSPISLRFPLRYLLTWHVDKNTAFFPSFIYPSIHPSIQRFIHSFILQYHLSILFHQRVWVVCLTAVTDVFRELSPTCPTKSKLKDYLCEMLTINYYRKLIEQGWLAAVCQNIIKQNSRLLIILIEKGNNRKENFLSTKECSKNWEDKELRLEYPQKKKATVVDPHTTHEWTHETNCSQSAGTAHDIESL